MELTVTLNDELDIGFGVATPQAPRQRQRAQWVALHHLRDGAKDYLRVRVWVGSGRPPGGRPVPTSS